MLRNKIPLRTCHQEHETCIAPSLCFSTRGPRATSVLCSVSSYRGIMYKGDSESVSYFYVVEIMALACFWSMRRDLQTALQS